MTRIELSPVPVKIVQCEHCGRVRLDGQWTHDAAVEVDVVGCCRTCEEWRGKLARARRRRDEAMTRAKARRGYGPAKPGEDVFAGFREGE